MHKLKMTARKIWINTPRTTDNTGKLLSKEEQEARRSSRLKGKVAIEIWTDRLALVRVELPIFAGREGLAVGQPDRGTMFGDSLQEAIQQLALRAWNDGKAEVEL